MGRVGAVASGTKANNNPATFEGGPRGTASSSVFGRTRRSSAGAIQKMAGVPAFSASAMVRRASAVPLWGAGPGGVIPPSMLGGRSAGWASR
jgi:hypothetical protein